jgi:hypothetical protein
MTTSPTFHDDLVTFAQEEGETTPGRTFPLRDIVALDDFQEGTRRVIVA